MKLDYYSIKEEIKRWEYGLCITSKTVGSVDLKCQLKKKPLNIAKRIQSTHMFILENGGDNMATLIMLVMMVFEWNKEEINGVQKHGECGGEQ
jgi:hypothetical protein